MWRDLLVAVESSTLASTVRGDRILYPAIQCVHLVGLGVLVGAAVAFDVRLLGAARQLSVRRLAGYLLPLVWLGFTATALSGLLQFAAHATAYADHPVMRVKLGLIAAAGLNAAIFHRWTYRTVSTWDAGPVPAAARLAGAASLVVWCAVVVCGRLVAYV